MIQLDDFSVGTIVYQTTPKNKEYGVVIKIISDDYRPVIIRWDCEPQEKYPYTLDEIEVIKIQIVPFLQPLKTLVELLPNEPIPLINGNTIILLQPAVCLVQSLENNLITLKDDKTDTIYQLLLDSFHQYGKPFGHLVSFPVYQPQPVLLSSPLLKSMINTWLTVNLQLTTDLLISLTENQKQALHTAFIEEIPPDYQYSLEELNHLWHIGLTEFTEQQLMEKGIYGFTLNGKVWDKITEKIGEITELIPKNLQIQIRWDETSRINYTVLELKALNIVPIHFIKLSLHVAYELSLDERSYLKAYISFKTKKLAQLWLPKLKSVIGRLSYLSKHENPIYQHLSPFIWEYEVEKFKHTTLSNKLEVLRKIASLDLQQPPR